MSRNTVDKKKKFPKKKRVIVSIITLVMVGIIGVVMGYFSYVKSKIYTEPNEVKLKTVEKKNEDDVDYKEVEGITNVLLVGTDGRDLEEPARADSIIIATLDSNNKQIRLTSLFRDTLVDIEGYGAEKLNAAMSIGGIELLKDTIRETYDINIDKHIIINFWGFEAIIDQIGGLEIDVKDYQLKELNKYIGESTGGNDCPVTETGLQLLNGKQALSYARIRKGVGDDFERTERQREVLFKVAEKLRDTKPTKYLGIVNSMLDYINTNIDIMDAINMAYTIYKFPSLDTKQIHIPITELSDDMNYGGGIGSVFIMDRRQNTEILHDFIFNGIEPDESKFDYKSLREALYEYKTGEWKSDYKNSYDNKSNKKNINKEDDEEEVTGEWE
ncbi:LCP family protein [Clostridium sp. D53t1_180928_C8]|uniref:LCP family protein n=1 Tax=Clostridium sp. D53t1_180928_C8 TaxID=2787101 RepID=UPI0018AC0228|nr:LCP family protein [Clostridium sp. D53t1_180928_C8]